MMFKKRCISTFFLSTLLILLLLASQGPFGFIIPLVIAALSVKGIQEHFAMVKGTDGEECKEDNFKPRSVCIASVLYTFLLYYFIEVHPSPSFALLDEIVFFTAFLVFFLIPFREWHQEEKKHSMMTKLAHSLTAFIYVPWCLNFILKILFIEKNGTNLVFFLILVSKSTDIFAYLVGKKWGKHRLAKQISPNKTLEGAIGGLLGSLLMAGIAQQTFVQASFTPVQALVLGFILSIVSQFGDLAESLLKRDSLCKDSGCIFWGIGGALDLVDSLLFSAPVMFFIVHLVLMQGI
jgi:phosphatidate cytidylyltransferase